MRIPQQKIDQIKQTADIVEIIGQYVNLKLRGKNYVGLCPFHQEKTPSFTVSPDKQIFYCFGCQTGGDVFSFIKSYEKISYPESIRMVAERYHIDLPKYRPADTTSENNEYDELYFIHKKVNDFFRNQLTLTSGLIALEYLKYRGFSEEMIGTYQIGYAPDRWDSLSVLAKDESLNPVMLQKAGLIMPRQDSSFYDRFRHRLMFPVMNPSGRVIAFGGRQMRDEPDSPKYLNSPETLIYHKSKVLYGLFQAREEILRKDMILIVEGYADCISMYQYGFKNVCASSGTAFTKEQCDLIRRYTQNVTLIFDSDEAGIRAAERAGALLLENALNTRITVIPDQKDPDGYIRKYGADAFGQLLKKAADYFEFRVNNYIRKDAFRTVHDRTQAAREMLNVIAGIKDRIRQDLFLREMVHHFGLNEQVIRDEFRKITRNSRSPLSGDNEKKIAAQSPAESAKPDIPEQVIKAERHLLRAVLHDPEFAKTLFSYLSPADFQVDGIRTVLEIVADKTGQDLPFSPADLIRDAEEPIQKAVTRLMMDDRDSFPWEDCVAIIQLNQLQKKSEELRYTIKAAEQQGDDIQRLQQLWNDLLKDISGLKSKKELIKKNTA